MSSLWKIVDEGRDLSMPVRRLAVALLVLFGHVMTSGAQEDAPRRVDVDEAPWSAVGRVHIGGGGYCTGVLVKPGMAVTAAHCLYNSRTRQMAAPVSVHFLLGYERGDYAHHSIAASYDAPDSFDPRDPKAALGSDWVLIELETPAPAAFEPMPIAATPPKEGTAFIAAGFAMERRHWLTATDPCEIIRSPAPDLLLGHCAVAPGYSGGPVMGLDGELMGIQTATGRSNGRSVMVGVASAAFRRRLAASE